MSSELAPAAPPRESWASGPGRAEGHLPEWGADGGGADSESDSEVEYDKVSAAGPEPVRRVAGWDEQAAFEAVANGVHGMGTGRHGHTLHALNGEDGRRLLPIELLSTTLTEGVERPNPYIQLSSKLSSV